MRYSLLLPSLAATVLMISCTATAPNPHSATNNGTGSTIMSSTGSSVDTGSGISVHTETVNYGPTNGYLAIPDASGKHPAIVLIHEWFGLNDNIRWYAEQFAKQGYVALAIDLYDGQSTQDPAQAQKLASSVQHNMDKAMANLQSAVTYLKTRSEVDSTRLASIGWCFGGGWSYQMAKNNLGVKATVMYYGQFAPKDDLSMMKAHIIGHYGDKDQTIPVDDVKAFRAKLQTLSGENQVFIYENQGHGFARELTTDSAKLAWQRTLAFLKQEL